MLMWRIFSLRWELIFKYRYLLTSHGTTSVILFPMNCRNLGKSKQGQLQHHLQRQSILMSMTTLCFLPFLCLLGSQTSIHLSKWYSVIVFYRMITWIVLVILKWLERYVVDQYYLAFSHSILYHHTAMGDLIAGCWNYQVGTDIQDFKCSWMVVKALELSNEEQKKLLHVSKKFISHMY